MSLSSQATKSSQWKAMAAQLAVQPSLVDVSTLKYLGPVTHVFTHIRHTYHAYVCGVSAALVAAIAMVISLNCFSSHICAQNDRIRWIATSETNGAAISTNMKKVSEQS